MPIHLTPESNPVVQEGTLYVDSATGEFNVAGRTTPHIIPGVLYPAVSGKLLDGSTSHGTGTYNGVSVSTNYGTTQSDGRKYYYTDIKGSKPIKDPRIGGHFGSQRHRMSSVQLLDQETATHGSNVYAVDGRNWMRCCATDKEFGTYYGGNGGAVECYGSNSSSFFEITGYFNSVNFGGWTYVSRGAEFSVNGGSVSTSNFFTTTVMNPLRDRFVPSGNYVNLTNSLTLGINTIKIIPEGSDTGYFFGVDLIAQDTSNRNNIQIPSQNVVSYGKKFTVSGTPHYNPFNGYTATTSFSSVVDVNTSLGLEAWKHTDNNYYPPINGGRVVKWVDSSGTIKTSVTLMPPNATGIGSFSSNPRDPNYGSWSSQYQPTFKNETERQLHEVAKAFHFREFGNGAVNGGTGATWADASMLSDDNDPSTGGSQSDNIAYVMDDGLTSLSGQSLRIQNLSTYGGVRIESNSQSMYFTFIGTGIQTIRQRDNSTTEEPVTWAQNLPYGTHILELQRDGSANQVAKIDGVTLETNSTTDKYLIHGSPTFFQPKRPPIPEDACVIADYMLMADFVAIGASGDDKISKGVRLNSASRDFFADTSDSTLAMAQDLGGGFITGHKLYTNSSNANAFTARLPSFGTNFVVRGYNVEERCDLYVGTTDSAQTDTNGNASYAHLNSNVTLGVNDFLHKNNASQNAVFSHYEIATPIHTSSHYQTFETPFLHELVGGDRNMEQNNLVCTPDGRTWDSLTRDTSYLGTDGFLVTEPQDTGGAVQDLIFTELRGVSFGSACYNKNFAIAYDRMICLKDGVYFLKFQTIENTNSQASYIKVNGTVVASSHTIAASWSSPNNSTVVQLKRGDHINVSSPSSENYSYVNFIAYKIR